MYGTYMGYFEGGESAFNVSIPQFQVVMSPFGTIYVPFCGFFWMVEGGRGVVLVLVVGL